MIRQPLLFIAVGGLQYLIDASFYALLISFGLPTTPANVTSRASAAGIGFLLNRYVTFGQRDETVARFGGSLFRFVVLFTAMTVISTLSILLLEAAWGHDPWRRIAAKLVVEAVLAVASFLVSRFWVYRD